jgi:hypothetical protein
MPDATVETVEGLDMRDHIDPATFLKSLPSGLSEVYRPYLEQWSTPPFFISWRKVGFSMRYLRPGRLPVTILEGYPKAHTDMSAGTEFGNRVFVGLVRIEKHSPGGPSFFSPRIFACFDRYTEY